jgi:broad-specificity NMP kinase
MSYFIIIRGSAGVGKSTISKLLAENIKAEIIHFDKVMKSLEMDYILGDKWIPLDKFLKADKIKIPEFRDKLEKEINLIIDGNFYHKEQIEDLINNLEFPNYIFTLKADLQECIKRDKSRDGELGEKATTDVFKLVSAFDYGTVIDTNGKTPTEIIDEIISSLPKSN